MAYKKKSPAKNIFNLTKSSAEANRRVNAGKPGSGVIRRPSVDSITKGDFTSSSTVNAAMKERAKEVANRPAYERPGTGSTKVDKPKTTVKPKTTAKAKSNTSTKSKPVVKTKPATKPIKSSGSGDRSGGYLKNTKNFSLGVDLSMPKSKMQTTVTNARSANTDLISGRMSKRDKIAARQSRKTARVRERVGNQIERIKGRQERAGIRAGAKIARKDKGVNVGKMESQRKLDAFEKSMDSPRATPRTSGAGNISSGSKPGQLRMPATNVTGQKAAQGSMKLKPTMSKTQTLSDYQLNKKLNKPAVKKKSTGKTKSLSMTRGERQKSLTDLAMTGKNN